MSEAAAVWADALLAARLLAAAPGRYGGMVVRARAGPVRDRLVADVQADLPAATPWRKLPAGASEDRLLGGLDLERTLREGRPAMAKGLVAEADGGFLVVPGAERLPAATVALLAHALDEEAVRVERDGLSGLVPARVGLLLLDEGEAGEGVAAALLDRVAFRVELEPVGLGDCGAAATVPGGTPIGEDAGLVALAEAAAALGVSSVRSLAFAWQVARALGGSEACLAVAARLVLAPRATRLPAEAGAPPAPAEADETPSDGEGKALADLLVEAARAALPPGVLAAMAAGETRARGGGAGAGEQRRGLRRGRPMGEVAGIPRDGRRLALSATLRAAAPWQRLRGAAGGRIAVRASDLRVRRYEESAGATTILVVDASGSAAAARLAEAKGAVELLLAESYVRRDEVALVAFRGAGADLLLPPTRSLTRAKRALGGLPGGGGTPLAAGLVAARQLARAERARGRSPSIVVMTDGRANVALDGSGGRERATDEASAGARALAGDRVPATVIDISPRAGPEAKALATALAARHIALPRADAAAVKAAVLA